MWKKVAVGVGYAVLGIITLVLLALLWPTIIEIVIFVTKVALFVLFVQGVILAANNSIEYTQGGVKPAKSVKKRR